MANLAALQDRQAAVQLAEQRAVHGLADYLREAVRDIPSESALPMLFVHYADKFDCWATGRQPTGWTRLSLEDLHRDLHALLDAESDGGGA